MIFAHAPLDSNNANDLKAIGGLRVLLQHLASKHDGIRWRACEVRVPQRLVCDT